MPALGRKGKPRVTKASGEDAYGSWKSRAGMALQPGKLLSLESSVQTPVHHSSFLGFPEDA